MKKLLRGLLDYRTHTLPGLADRMSRLAEDGQHPEVLFFACSDSRVVPNQIVSTDPGDMFVVRTVGNLVAPAAPDGVSVGDVSEASAIEFAVHVLGVKHIIMCGHSCCGAMKATLAGRDKLTDAPNLAAWLAHAEPARERLSRAPFISQDLPPEDRLSQANVFVQLDNVATFGGVRKLAKSGTLWLHAWWFDVATGDVLVFDEGRGEYVMLDEGECDRVLSGATACKRQW